MDPYANALVIPLGTRGWMPQGGRQTICTFVRLGEAQFLLDCGTGASRLLEPAVRAHMHDRGITLLFSHFHLDHFAGLVYLPGVLRGYGGPVRLAGPNAELVAGGLRAACERLTSPPLSSQPYADFSPPVEIVEFGREGIEIDGVAVAAAPQRHPGGSVTLRLGDALCYATDLAAATPDLPLAAGVDLLIHETWTRGAQAPHGDHSGLPDALARARRAGVTRLMPFHFNPAMLESEIQDLAAASTPGLEVLVPAEGSPLPPFAPTTGYVRPTMDAADE